MTKNDSHRHVIARASAMLALLAIMSCGPGSPGDPASPAGRATYVLSFDEFAATVNPILSRLGCDNLNCHGGANRGAFALTPPGAKNAAADFEQARRQVYPPHPSQSPLLLKPLAAECGGAEHEGGAYFFSFDDPDYVAILTWIENGEYQ